MQRRLLATALALALMTQAPRAQADVIKDFVNALLLVAVVGTVTIGTAEALTVAATYKNARAAHRREDPSAGWIGVGAVGGTLNMAAGGLIFAGSLPRTREVACGDPPNPPQLRPVPNSPGWCLDREPASVGGLVAGTLLVGFGAFALGSAGWAIKNAPDERAAPMSPGTVPVAVGFQLPALSF
ncbi:MAG: hypothetical protein MUF64_04540 [Polyangiaceae bacterium]|jgi:hypothetical protein|nr:hypothetical protein [Polyangiaceae bacterium]